RNGHDPSFIRVSESFDLRVGIRHLAVDQHGPLALNQFDQSRKVFGDLNAWRDDQTAGIGQSMAQFSELSACPLHHRGLVPVEEWRAPVRLILRRASQAVEIENALETGDPLKIRSELSWLTAGNIDLISIFEINRKLAFVPVKRNRPTISKINGLTVCECVGPGLRLIDSAGIIIGKPNRLGPISSNWRALKDECKKGIGKCTVGPGSPRCFHGRMMMLVANHQDTGCSADRLQSIEQSLNRRPGCAQIEIEGLNVLITARDFRHESSGHAPKILSPLVYDLRPRCNDHNTINFISPDQFLSDCTCCNGLARAWCGVDQKTTILPIDNKPLERFVERFKLPWA